MTDCQHQWEMTNIKYGFIVFEKCFQCDTVRTYFAEEESPFLWDEYREGKHFWTRLESAQSIRFDLKCTKCGHLETFGELMGFLFCTGCLPNCEIDILRRKYEPEKTWIMVAFGFLPKEKSIPISDEKIKILTDYFNQHRDTARSRIKIVSYNLIDDIRKCKGEFIHDVGMLSREPVTERKPLF